jgi:hypothetical protein
MEKGKMKSIKMTQPEPNTWCKVRVIPCLTKRTCAYKFVTYSDGGHFWDDGIGEILQDREVTHWKEIK